MSQSGTEKLARLESTSYSISAGLVSMQSEITAISTPLHNIHNSLPGVQAQLDSIHILLRHVLAGPSPASCVMPQEVKTRILYRFATLMNWTNLFYSGRSLLILPLVDLLENLAC